MRMGKLEKARRGEPVPVRADAKGSPRNAARGSVVGKLSPDVISTYLAPELMRRASRSLEQYSDDLLQYEELMKDFEKHLAEAQVDEDGSVQNMSEPPTQPITPLFQSQYWVDEFDELLKETSKYFHDKKGGWKIHAKAARFERMMDEKYGILRPFLKDHPEVEQFVRSVQRKYAAGYFSPLRQGKPPIPKSTAVIILFMMQRGNLKWEVLVLAALFFLVGLQPWALVVLVAGGHQIMEGRRKRPIKPMKSFIPATEPYYPTSLTDEGDERRTEAKSKTDILSRPVGTKLGADEQIDGSDFDAIVLGSGPATLYTAALLSRANRKVLVLSSKSDASGCYQIENGSPSAMKKFGDVAFDVESSNISKVSAQQRLLAPALSSTTDHQGGIRFARIGSPADGYAFEILAVPGMGTDRGDTDVPFVLRADGVPSLMEDAAATLGDGWPGVNGEFGNSLSGVYAATCAQINATSNQFYISKVLPDSINGMRSKNTYQEASLRYASSFLEKGFPLNPHARSLLAAIGMKGENIKPSMTSMAAAVTNISGALCGEGMHYPVGGPRALCHALAAVIQQCGGKVVTHVPLSEFIFDEGTIPQRRLKKTQDGDTEVPEPRCVGVKLSDNRVVKFDMEKQKRLGVSPAIISMHGFVSTFIRLLPDDVRTKYKVPRGLPALSEQRPVFKVMFALDGSAEELELSGADFYRVPGAARAQDEIDPVTGQVKFGEIGWVDDDSEINKFAVEDVNSSSNEDPQVSENSSARVPRDKFTRFPTAARKKKKEIFESGGSWIKISFPSAKDPSFESRHGKISTCVATIEADDDFVTLFDTKPRLYSIQKRKSESNIDYTRLIERVQKDLLHTYPQLEGKIVHAQLIGPLHGGLSHNPERYAAKGVRPESSYPGLYVGGSDLTVGDSFSGSIVGGWLAVNAVMGYSAVDYLYLRKNITADIARCLESPETSEEDDLAVPYEKSDSVDAAVED